MAVMSFVSLRYLTIRTLFRVERSMSPFASVKV